ncbi:hypothetical protein [Komagataeibacter europaeus]
MSAARRHRQDASQIAPDIDLEAFVGWREDDGLDQRADHLGRLLAFLVQLGMQHVVQPCELPVVELRHLWMEQGRGRFGVREEVPEFRLAGFELRSALFDRLDGNRF